MNCTRREFLESMRVSCRESTLFGADADFDKTFEVWVTRLMLAKAAEQLATQLFIKQLDNKLLREYLDELNTSGVVIFAIDSRDV